MLIAYVYLALRQKNEAFSWLEKGYEQRSGLTLWWNIDPKIDLLRGDPRLTDLLQRIGLPKQKESQK